MHSTPPTWPLLCCQHSGGQVVLQQQLQRPAGASPTSTACLQVTKQAQAGRKQAQAGASRRNWLPGTAARAGQQHICNAQAAGSSRQAAAGSTPERAQRGGRVLVQGVVEQDAHQLRLGRPARACAGPGAGGEAGEGQQAGGSCACMGANMCCGCTRLGQGSHGQRPGPLGQAAGLGHAVHRCRQAGGGGSSRGCRPLVCQSTRA